MYINLKENFVVYTGQQGFNYSL